MCSDNGPKFSPLLRGLASALCSGIIWFAILESGADDVLGSQGIGLFGSLESQLGMLLCLCMGISVEKELRLMPFVSGSAAIVMKGLVVVV